MATNVIDVKKDIRAEQQAQAERFRQRMTNQGTLVVRLLSSPGSGKTSLIQVTANRLADRTVAALVGDIETHRDADRLKPYAPAVQITTGGSCHLEIPQVERAYGALPPDEYQFLFIEDVGNLVCPASYDLGEHLRVVLLSTPEGDDKPAKYPKAFHTSDALVITKCDLQSHVNFDVERAVADALQVQPALHVFKVSPKTGDGIGAWCDYLRKHWEDLTFND